MILKCSSLWRFFSMEIFPCIDSFCIFVCLDLNCWGLRHERSHCERLRVIGLRVVAVVAAAVG